MPTLDEIREHAGYQDFSAYRTYRRFANRVAVLRGDIRPKDEDRGMGYTTEMLLQALHKCSDGAPVYIVEEILDPCKRLLRKAQKLARQCGFDPDLIIVGENTTEFVTGLPVERVFFDHTVDRPITTG